MIISVGNIFLQRFLPEHTDLLFNLSNRPEIRSGMRERAKIPYESHVSWVKENLIEGNNVHLFLAIDGPVALGAALIKNITKDSGEVGIIVSDSVAAKRASLTGKLVAGISYYAFCEMKFQYLDIKIIPGNDRSIAAAKKVGAEFQGQDETYKYFLLKKQTYETFPLNKLLFSRYQPFCIPTNRLHV